MKVVNIGIIGAGWVSHKHLEVLRDMEGVKVVGITSRTMGKAMEVAKKFSITHCVGTIAELLHIAKPDALMILVPEDQMYQVVTDVIPLHIPLFIEKPPGLHIEEARTLCRLARAHDVRTMVGFNRRFYSVFHKGFEIVKQHGQVFGITVEGHERMWRIHAGGKFSDNILRRWIYANSIHTIDLLRFFGGDIQHITSIAHKRFGEENGDQFGAMMELSSGAIGQYSSFWYSPGGWRVVLYGDGVTMECKPLEEGRWVDKEFNIHPIIPDAVDVKYKPGFYRQMEAFVALVCTGKMRWPGSDLDDAYKTMELVAHISAHPKNF